MIWHDVENGSLRRGPAALAGARDRGGGPILDLGAGTGRVALDLAAPGTRSRRSTRTPCSSTSSAARASAASRVACRRADARSIGSRSFALVIAPMQLLQIMGGRAAAGSPASERARAARPDGLFAAAISDPRRGRSGGRPSAAARRPSATAGSTRACRWTSSEPGGVPWSGCARPSPPPASSSRRTSHRGARLAERGPARARGGEAGLRPVAQREVPEPATTSAAWWSYAGAEGLLALSRADEHLRRPRQHRGPARALRVARHRLRARRREPRGAARPGRPRPLLHGRRPGPRPGRGGPRHGPDQARRPARGRGPRRGGARGLRRLPAARPLLRAGRRAAARRRASWTCARCASRARA